MTLKERLQPYLSSAEVEYLNRESTSAHRRLDLQGSRSFSRAAIREAVSRPRQPLPHATIPLQLMQFWDTVEAPDDVQECMDSWRTLCAYQMIRYDRYSEEGAIQFIEKEFDRRHRDAYLHCHHPAMKADYFRLAYLLVNGGMYVDADNMSKGIEIAKFFQTVHGVGMFPLCRDITPPGRMCSISKLSDADYTKDFLRFFFANDPLLAVSGNDIILRAFNRATRLLQDGRLASKECRISWTTGPDNVTIALYDAGLDAFRDNRDLDFRVLLNWNRFGTQKWDLAYRGTPMDWRSL